MQDFSHDQYHQTVGHTKALQFHGGFGQIFRPNFVKSEITCSNLAWQKFAHKGRSSCQECSRKRTTAPGGIYCVGFFVFMYSLVYDFRNCTLSQGPNSINQMQGDWETDFFIPKKELLEIHMTWFSPASSKIGFHTDQLPLFVRTRYLNDPFRKLQTPKSYTLKSRNRRESSYI